MVEALNAGNLERNRPIALWADQWVLYDIAGGELAVKLIFTAREASERLERLGPVLQPLPADIRVQASAQSTIWSLVGAACSPSLRSNKYLRYMTR